LTEQNNFETIKYLIETLSSIKSSLDSIEKDTSRKASNIQNISEQLIIIIDALKNSNDKNSHAYELINQRIDVLTKTVDELKSRMDVAEVKREHFGEKVDNMIAAVNDIIETVGDINIKTEVSAEAMANIEKYVVDSKDILLELKVKNAIEFIKNLDNVYKTILAIALLIALIATFFANGSLSGAIVEIVKGLF
jgi:phage-related minor tail protein